MEEKRKCKDLSYMVGLITETFLPVIENKNDVRRLRQSNHTSFKTPRGKGTLFCFIRIYSYTIEHVLLIFKFFTGDN